MLIFSLAVFLAMLVTYTDGHNKKVVIHVPYKVKKIKHTHTVYKTVHHHHHDPHVDHGLTEEHEHFHHMNLHEDPPFGQRSQPVPVIPEFLRDGTLDASLEVPDIPHVIPGLPNRHSKPLYRRS